VLDIPPLRRQTYGCSSPVHKRQEKNVYFITAVLNLWAADHWWAADLCLVGRDQGWELEIFWDANHVSQSMKRY